MLQWTDILSNIDYIAIVLSSYKAPTSWVSVFGISRLPGCYWDNHTNTQPYHTFPKQKEKISTVLFVALTNITVGIARI